MRPQGRSQNTRRHPGACASAWPCDAASQPGRPADKIISEPARLRQAAILYPGSGVA